LNKRTIFLFGLAGAGKSFLAKHICRKFGYFLYEGDEDITPAMRSAIANKTDFTDEVRDEFFYIMAEKIITLQRVHEYVVIAQGLYRNRHRNYLLQTISGLELVWVHASDELIRERLIKRDGIAITPEYAIAIRKNFEIPCMHVLKVSNDGPVESVESKLELFGDESM
jgi:gluconokinase